MALLGALQGCSSPTQPTPDVDAPTLTCPVSLSVPSPDGNPVAVTYTTPTAIGGQRPVIVTCTPASGQAFPVGSTTVECRASDAMFRQASCSFAATVTAPPRIERELFMAFGDSLTAGKPALNPSEVWAGAYPLELAELLHDRYTAQDPTVAIEALAGETAVLGLDRFRDVLFLHNPEVVLLMEGANDIAHSDGDTYVPAAAEALEEMVLLSQGSGAVVFLATLPPQRAGAQRARGAPFVRAMNEAIRRVAARTGATLVDVHQAFNGQASTELVDWDGLHLTKAGYKLVAETFFREIRKELEVTPAS